MNDNFLRNLFAGTIDQDGIYPYPKLDPGEQEMISMLLDQIGKFAEEKIDGEKIDEEHEVPEEILDGLKEMGVFGMIVPEEYGGYGFSLSAFSRVMEEITRYCASTSITLGAHESIGMKGIILFGNEEQKKKYLPKLATGEYLGAYALTEPGAGSDASHLQTTAVFDESENVYVVNGTKQWITNGGIADVYTLFASSGKRGLVSAFILEGNTPGLSVGKYEDKLGLRGSKTAQLILENVKIPAENLLYRHGRGFKVALEILNTGRVSLSGSCIGVAKEMLRLATDFALQRKQFGAPIAELEMIQNKIYRIACTIYAMECIVYHTTALVDGGVPDFSTESAVCKFFSTDALWWIINEALQISGGNGYMMEYPYQRYLRDARINLIFEGTNEVNRMYAGYTGLKHVSRTLGAGGPMGTGSLSFAPEPLKGEADRLRKIITGFGERCTHLVQAHGPESYRMEFHLERLSECVANLYTSCAVLSRTTAMGDDPNAMLLARGYLAMALPRAEALLAEDETANDEIKRDVAKFIYDSDGYPFDRWTM